MREKRVLPKARLQRDRAGALEEFGFCLEQFDCAQDASGEGVGEVVGLRFEGFGCFEFFFHAQIAAGQCDGDGEVGVGVHPDDPVFDAACLWGGDRFAQADGSVVAAPFQVDRGGGVGDQSSVGIHIWGEDQDGGGEVGLQASDEVEELLRAASSGC